MVTSTSTPKFDEFLGITGETLTEFIAKQTGIFSKYEAYDEEENYS